MRGPRFFDCGPPPTTILHSSAWQKARHLLKQLALQFATHPYGFKPWLRLVFHHRTDDSAAALGPCIFGSSRWRLPRTHGNFPREGSSSGGCYGRARSCACYYPLRDCSNRLKNRGAVAGRHLGGVVGGPYLALGAVPRRHPGVRQRGLRGAKHVAVRVTLERLKTPWKLRTRLDRAGRSRNTDSLIRLLLSILYSSLVRQGPIRQELKSGDCSRPGDGFATSVRREGVSSSNRPSYWPVLKQV